MPEPLRPTVATVKPSKAFKQAADVMREVLKAVAAPLAAQVRDSMQEEVPVRTGALRDSHRVEEVKESRTGVQIIIAAGGRGTPVNYQKTVHDQNPWMERAAEKNEDKYRETVVQGWNERA